MTEPRQMATPRPVRMPVALQTRRRDVRLPQAHRRYEVPSYSSCLSAIGGFLFLVAFTVGLLVIGPTLALAIAGGQ